MDFFEKLYTARTLLCLNQKEAGDRAGISQATIGSLEKGERNAIPVTYANFLYKNGVDLNGVFNNEDNGDMNVFRKEDNINSPVDKLSVRVEHPDIFIDQQLPETLHLTHSLTKHLEKLHTGLSKMKRLTKIIKLNTGVNTLNRIQDNK